MIGRFLLGCLLASVGVLLVMAGMRDGDPGPLSYVGLLVCFVGFRTGGSALNTDYRGRHPNEVRVRDARQDQEDW